MRWQMVFMWKNVFTNRFANDMYARKLMANLMKKSVNQAIMRIVFAEEDNHCFVEHVDIPV